MGKLGKLVGAVFGAGAEGGGGIEAEADEIRVPRLSAAQFRETYRQLLMSAQAEFEREGQRGYMAGLQLMNQAAGVKRVLEELLGLSVRDIETQFPGLLGQAARIRDEVHDQITEKLSLDFGKTFEFADRGGETAVSNQ